MTRKIYYTMVPDNEPETLRRYAKDFKKFLFEHFNVFVINDWLSDSTSAESIFEGLPEDSDRGFYLVAHHCGDIYYGWKSPKCIFNKLEDEYVEISLNENFIGFV